MSCDVCRVVSNPSVDPNDPRTSVNHRTFVMCQKIPFKILLIPSPRMMPYVNAEFLRIVLLLSIPFFF